MPAKKSVTKEPARASRASAPGLIVHRLELTPEGKRQGDAVADQFGMTQVAALSRLVGWFAGQPPEIQQRVLNGGDAARPILERMAGRTA